MSKCNAICPPYAHKHKDGSMAKSIDEQEQGQKTEHDHEFKPKGDYMACECGYKYSCGQTRENELVKELHEGKSVKATDLCRSMGIEVIEM